MKEADEEDERDRVAPNMEAGGSHPKATSDPRKKEKEKKETQVLRWADCNDEEVKENEEEAEEKKEREEESRAEEAREKEARAQEEREEEREVEAQEGHEEAKEVTTQEKCVEAKKETNSMYEESDVLKRHMTWWRDTWWVRMDNGPHLRTARGRRRVWRAATRAARRETERIAGGEREKWEQGTTERKESNTLHVVFHFPTTATTPTTPPTATAAATTAAAVAATRLQ